MMSKLWRQLNTVVTDCYYCDGVCLQASSRRMVIIHYPDLCSECRTVISEIDLTQATEIQ